MGDDAHEPQWLKTASRVGYRFIGDVVEETIAAVPAEIAVIPPVPVVATQGVHEPGGIAKRGWPPSSRGIYAAGLGVIALAGLVAGFFGTTRSAAPAVASGIATIAVLPLANLSGEPDHEFFADGMTEELITSWPGTRRCA